MRVGGKKVDTAFPWPCRARRPTEKNSIPPIFTKGGYLDSCIQLIYTSSEEGRCLVLRIESLEIDDHILDKIESKHSISFQEVEEA